MTRLAAAMAAALLLSAPCTPAYAQASRGYPTQAVPTTPPPDTDRPPPLCAPLAMHAAYLARRWGERPFAPGRVGRAAIVILFINPVKRTWTLVRVLDRGFGCAIGAGRLPARAPVKPKSPPKPKGSVL